MKTIRVILTTIFILMNIVLVSGCWNYREIDELAVVSGVAIDKGVKEKFKLAIEIVELSEEKEAKVKPKIVIVEGDTIFEAVRHAISSSGKRLYWSHAKVVVISQEIAKDGVVQILDWFNRDSETRADIHIFISKEKTAEEILAAQGKTDKINGFEMNDVLDNEKSLSNAPQIEIWKFTNTLQSQGIASIATAVDLVKIGEGPAVPHIMGSAIFKGDKFLGFIDGEDTKFMLFVLDEIEGGILAVEGGKETISTTVTLEIFKNRTNIKPVVHNGSIEMNVSVETIVAIDEIENTENVIDEEGRKKLEAFSENFLKNHIEATIQKVQAEYGVDIFGFGSKLNDEDPKLWKNISLDWGARFKKLKVNVDCKIHIRNSAMLSEPLEVND